MELIKKEENNSELELMIKGSFQFTDPRNVRDQKQLDIMMQMEEEGKDPLDPKFIEQEILFQTDFWYVSRNRFPYEEIQHHYIIASRYPVYNLIDMSTEMWIDLKNIWERLILEYNVSGGALCYRFGETIYSGASLTRLHCHLIMPKKGNKTKFTIGGNLAMKEKFDLDKYPQLKK